MLLSSLRTHQYALLTIIDNSLFNTFAFLSVSVKLLDSIVNFVVVYRPPGQDLSKFISEFEVLLQVLSKEKSLSYICGDFNINLLNYDTHLLTQSYLDLLLSFSFRPLINMPTRITEPSCTLIDKMFTNDLSNEHFSGILYSDISDHLPVFTLLSSKDSQSQTCDSNILKRQFSDKNKCSFLTDQIKLGYKLSKLRIPMSLMIILYIRYKLFLINTFLCVKLTIMKAQVVKNNG